ncbi:hypothetical protein [Mucilaginibacter ginsenosidivorax]|nr:hypothetical protein [Mucilaginibacter ginsenosidivorax]
MTFADVFIAWGFFIPMEYWNGLIKKIQQERQHGALYAQWMQ